MYLEVTTAHVNADDQVVGPIYCYDIDGANVCIKQCVIVHSPAFAMSAIMLS